LYPQVIVSSGSLSRWPFIWYSCILFWFVTCEVCFVLGREKAERGELDKRAGDEQLDKFIISLSSEKVRLVVDFTINVLGLSQCANTIVGNAYVRGCSGGERKRVTTGGAHHFSIPHIHLP
jgi:hypothetical protein